MSNKQNTAVKAQLTPQSNPFYKNNVLIEALPPYHEMSDRRIKTILSSNNPKPPEPENMSDTQKIDFLKAVFRKIFVCLPIHQQLFRAVDDLIRSGYLSRKHIDFDKIFPKKQKAADSCDKTGSEDESEQIDGYTYVPFDENDDKYGILSRSQEMSSLPVTATTTPTMSLIGWSGLGKTCSCNRILSFYPQLIEHPRTPINESFMQVVWLKVPCPPQPSPKDLCINILQALDNAAGTDYRARITQRMTLGYTRNITLEALKKYYVGLLVIDEIQNIVNHSQQERFFNFIVELSNTLKTPLVFVGTPKINRFLSKDFRILRRFGSCGYFSWEKLTTEPLAPGKRSVFDVFCDELCMYNLTDNEQIISPQVRAALYDCSQGITDILVKLFMFTQIQCLHHNRPLNADAVRVVFEMYFSKLKPVISAMQRSDFKTLEKYADLNVTDCVADPERLINSILSEPIPPIAEPQIEDLDDIIEQDYTEGAQKTAESFMRLIRNSPYGFDTKQQEQLKQELAAALKSEPNFSLVTVVNMVEIFAARVGLNGSASKSKS